MHVLHDLKEHDMKKDLAPTLSAIVTGMPGATIDRIMPTGKEGQYKASGKMPTHEALIMWLDTFAKQVPPEGGMEFITGMADYFRKHLTMLAIKPGAEEGTYECTYNIRPFKTEGSPDLMRVIGEATDKYLQHPFVKIWIQGIYGEAIKKQAKRKKKAVTEKKEPAVRFPGSVISNTLKRRPTLFDSLAPEMQKEIMEAKINEVSYVDVNWRIEKINSKGDGIRFDGDQMKMILILWETMQDASATDHKHEAYYLGNIKNPKENILYYGYANKSGNVDYLPLPTLECSFNKIVSSYTGKSKPSGDDRRIVFAIIKKLSEDPATRCALTWTRKTTDDKIDTVLEYRHLISYQIIQTRDIATGETSPLTIRISMHNMFAHNLDKRYAWMPRWEAIAEAYGSQKVPIHVTNLIMDIAVANGNKNLEQCPETGRRVYKIGQENAFYKILPNYMPPNRRRIPKAKTNFQKAAETILKLKMCESFTQEPAADGGINYVFMLPLKPQTDKNPQKITLKKTRKPRKNGTGR